MKLSYPKTIVFLLSITLMWWLLFYANEQGYYRLLNSRADLLNSSNWVLDDLIDEWEPSRSFSPTFVFNPDNSVYFDKCTWNNCDYYVLDVPNNTIDIWIDNVTSKPGCDYGWRYKFQWYQSYFKLWEWVSDADISRDNANYPVLSSQEWTNKNYEINWNEITVYFDKIITNAQFYDFVMNRNVVVYSDFKTWKQSALYTWSSAVNVIEWTNKLEIILADNYIVDYWRILIKKNVIADTDWRIAPNDILVWDKLEIEWVPQYVIDNNVPVVDSISWTWTFVTQVDVVFSENIYEISWLNIAQNVKDQFNNKLSNHPNFAEASIDWNELKIFFFTWSNITDVKVNTWAIKDKLGNWNNGYWGF